MNKIVVGLIGLGVGFLIGLAVAWQPLLLDRLYQDFNWFEMSEDGSYQGETSDGVWINGCIKEALCQD